MANPRICSVENCSKPHLARGLCAVHYSRVKRFGSTEYTPERGKRLVFIEDVALRHVGDDCLIWPFSFTGENYASGGGYPQFAMGRSRKIAAHRFICERVNGPAPTGYEAAHSCGNSRCVSPSHLSWKTPRSNTADKALHGTQTSGERHPVSKLTQDQIDQIRALRGTRSQSRIAADFGINQSYVSQIQLGKRWARS